MVWDVLGYCHAGAPSLWLPSCFKMLQWNCISYISGHLCITSSLIDCSTLKNKFMVHDALPVKEDFWYHLPFLNEPVSNDGNCHIKDCLFWGWHRKYQGFITHDDDLSQTVSCIGELTIVPHAVTDLFLPQHLWYGNLHVGISIVSSECYWVWSGIKILNFSAVVSVYNIHSTQPPSPVLHFPHFTM